MSVIIMIAKITVENFFSFGKKQEININPEVNILVGINGTGKSNFIKAITLLYESIVGEGMESIISKNWGGFTSIVNFSDSNTEAITITYEFDINFLKGYIFKGNPRYQITITKQGNLGAYTLSEWVYNESIEEGQTPFTYLKIDKGVGVISKKEKHASKIARFEALKPNELVLRQISDPEQYYPLFTLRKAVENIVVYNYFDTTSSSIVRQLSPFYSEKFLFSDGRNLAYFLSDMSNNDINSYNKIRSLLNTINPNFEDFGFSIQGAGKILLTLKEKRLSKAITIEQISDGTLRFLLLLCICYNPNRGNLICIDEPEIGLHPDMIATIAEAIKFASKKTQLIIATHSPLLLNAFDLEDIKVFDKDEQNNTTIESKKEEDFENWNENSLLGQFWLRGELGGTRW
jgi:predicted ATPase